MKFMYACPFLFLLFFFIYDIVTQRYATYDEDLKADEKSNSS